MNYHGVNIVQPEAQTPILRLLLQGVDSFSVFQDVDLVGSQPSITNVVDFGPSVGYLRVRLRSYHSVLPTDVAACQVCADVLIALTAAASSCPRVPWLLQVPLRPAASLLLHTQHDASCTTQVEALASTDSRPLEGFTPR